MKKTALLLAVVMLLSAFAGCGGAKEEAPKTDAPAAEAPAAPAEGAAAAPSRTDLHLSLNKVFSSVDPHNTRTGADVMMHGQMYEALYQLDEVNGGYLPRIAESYEISDDNLSWTFKIREGVKFHNGDTLTAKDVVFSFERGKEAAVLQAFLSAVESVEAPDDNTFVVHLTQPVAAFLNQITNVFIVSEREVTEQGEAFGTQVTTAGTGPYVLTSYDSATGWTFEAFPEYWRGEAAIKNIDYKVVTDAAAGLMAFENGELDFYTCSASDLALLEGNDKYTIQTVPANHISYIFINWMANEHLEKDAVRQAIAHAINKDEMNMVAFEGMAEIADFMENPRYVYCAPTETKTYEYNPDLSRQLLAEAGYTEPVYVGVITTAANTYYDQMATVLKSQLAEVGIEVDINSVETSTATANFRVQNYDIGILGGNGQGDYAAFRQRVASTSVGSYYVKLEGEKFDYKAIDALFDEGDIEPDPAKRAEIYNELNNRMMETTCWLPVFYKIMPYVWDANLNAVPGHTNYYVYDWNWN